MTDHRRLLEEFARRALAQKEQAPLDYLQGTFPQQRAFLEDDFFLKMAHCPRGAAKSYTLGLGIYRTMERFPGCSTFYVTKTRDMARNIMWAAVMKQIAADFKIEIEFNETLLEGRYPNGSIFRLTGIDGDKKQQDKLLGGKYKLVVLDEVAFFDTDLTSIIYRTLIPAVARIGGSIWLASTSSDYPRGVFYEATRPEKEKRIKGWHVHEWCWRDNIYVRDELEKTRQKLIADNPLIVETNHYQQHWENKWTIDESKLAYRFSPERNLCSAIPQLPRDGWCYVLGVDLGWEDDTAFVLTAYHLNDPHLYVIRTQGRKGMSFDQVEEQVLVYMADPVLAPHKIVIDGANKQGVESMRLRSSIPFEYADKQDKATFIELCNGDLVQGKIKMLETEENEELWDEMGKLVWEVEGDQIKYPKKEKEGIPNHRCFVAGTSVRTPTGLVPIETLRVGGLVETREGPRRIQNCISGVSPVIRLHLSDGREIVCTPDHPFWSSGQWIAAKDLRPSHPLFRWTDHQQELSECRGAARSIAAMVKDTSVGKTRRNSPSASICIASSGRPTMGEFRMAATFITRMGIRAITGLRTWIVSRPPSTPSVIRMPDSRPCSPSIVISLRHGIVRLPAENGIVSTGRRPSRSSRRSVPGAGPDTRSLICTKPRADAAQPNVSQPSAGRRALTTLSGLARTAGRRFRSTNTESKSRAPLHVLSTTELPSEEQVFSLTVEDKHEYFAADVLVSNCDAFLYAWRCGFHYHWEKNEKKPPVGSKAWFEKQAENIWEQERERLIAEAAKPMWAEDDGGWGVG